MILDRGSRHGLRLKNTVHSPVFHELSAVAFYAIVCHRVNGDRQLVLVFFSSLPQYQTSVYDVRNSTLISVYGLAVAHLSLLEYFAICQYIQRKMFQTRPVGLVPEALAVSTPVYKGIFHMLLISFSSDCS